MIAPVFERLSDQYPAAVFLKADGTRCQALSAGFGVTAFPTFLFLRGGHVVETMRGADPAGLEANIVRLLSGGGGAAGSDEAAAAAADPSMDSGVPGMRVLNDFVSMKESECLNECDEHPLANALADDTATYLLSDCDEQVIITLSFQQPIKVHSLLLAGPDDGRAPKSIKLFTNHASTVDFDDAERLSAVQELALTPEDVAGEGQPVALRYVKFQQVSSLTIFVADNQGDEEQTAITRLRVIGQPKDATNMDDFKRVSGKKGERE